MKTIKLIGGIFLVTALSVACTNDDIVTPVEPTDGKTVELSLNTEAGVINLGGGNFTRAAADVDASGCPKAGYPLNDVFLVRANETNLEECYKMANIKTLGTRLTATLEGGKVKFKHSSNPNAIAFDLATVTPNGGGSFKVVGGSRCFFSSLPCPDPNPLIKLPGGDNAREYGDKLFRSAEYVFAEEGGSLAIYQVYPVTKKVFPKPGNSMWPIDLERMTATLNLKFMLIMGGYENIEEGATAEEVKARWEELFPTISMDEVFTDGARLTNCLNTFNIRTNLTNVPETDDNLEEYLAKRLIIYDASEITTGMKAITYNRVDAGHTATHGWGFNTKAYPFIFPILDFDRTSRMQIDIALPHENMPGKKLRMKFSIPMVASQYAFKSNTTTFLYLMMDIDLFRGFYLDAMQHAKSATRAGAEAEDIVFELPESCLKLGVR